MISFKLYWVIGNNQRNVRNQAFLMSDSHINFQLNFTTYSFLLTWCIVDSILQCCFMWFHEKLSNFFYWYDLAFHINWIKVHLKLEKLILFRKYLDFNGSLNTWHDRQHTQWRACFEDGQPIFGWVTKMRVCKWTSKSWNY